MYQVLYQPAAQDDLEEIVRFLAEPPHNLKAARRFVSRMILEADALSEHPYRSTLLYPVRPLSREYRSILIHHYRIFFTVEERRKRVEIARILYDRPVHPSGTRR